MHKNTLLLSVVTPYPPTDSDYCSTTLIACQLTNIVCRSADVQSKSLPYVY